MSFHDVRFPAAVSRGSSGGPERRTDIVTLANGYEERNTAWAASRRRYDAGLGVRSLADIDVLVAFFEARRGRLYGFRWKDWADCRSCAQGEEPDALDQELGIGDGARTTFALCKHYASGGHDYIREITRPVAGSVSVAVDGVTLPEGVGWSLDAATGRVALAAAPQAGAVVTAGFDFDVPVRFDTDRLDISYTAFSAGEVPSVPVVEIRA